MDAQAGGRAVRLCSHHPGCAEAPSCSLHTELWLRVQDSCRSGQLEGRRPCPARSQAGTGWTLLGLCIPPGPVEGRCCHIQRHPCCAELRASAPSSRSTQKHADTGVRGHHCHPMRPCILHLETCRSLARGGCRRLFREHRLQQAPLLPGPSGSAAAPALLSLWTPAPSLWGPSEGRVLGQLASPMWPESPTLAVTHLLLPGLMPHGRHGQGAECPG